jgi:uncharacterized protein
MMKNNQAKNDTKAIQEAVELWFNSVVLGLKLCPFAEKPAREKRVRFYVSQASQGELLIADLTGELALLDKTSAADIETTLIIVPFFLNNFFDYNQFLLWAKATLKRNGWQGVYQIASFHPHYCFAGAKADAVENLTNRAPYAILHIIREASLTAALSYIGNSEEIPERNKQCVRNLTETEKKQLFPYLF